MDNQIQPIQEETRVCIECGRELPLSTYWRTKKVGIRCKICPDCCKAIRERKRAKRLSHKAEPVPDLFKDKTPRDVMNIMVDCKQHLESLGGYKITLNGIYTETITKKLKF